MRVRPFTKLAEAIGLEREITMNDLKRLERAMRADRTRAAGFRPDLPRIRRAIKQLRGGRPATIEEARHVLAAIRHHGSQPNPTRG